MKILLGVDSGEVYRPALAMLKRLKFSGAELHLVNCVSSVMVDGSFPEPVPGGVLSEINEQIRADGLAELDEAEALAGAEFKVIKHQGVGDPARVLLEYADKSNVDLSVVASQTKDYLGSLFFGSVAKALVNSSKASVLVVKSHADGAGGVRAVLGADHSEYLGKRIQLLKSWSPMGIESIHVVSAYGSTGKSESQSQSSLESEVSAKNEELKGFVSGLNAVFSSEAVHGRPGPVLDEAYASQKADLLILGAQGHGFFERFTLGSVSFHQVVSTRHNVLVLRG